MLCYIMNSHVYAKQNVIFILMVKGTLPVMGLCLHQSYTDFSFTEI